MSSPMDRYYNQGKEATRLDRPSGRLEFLRTLDILARFLPAAPASLLDVGGGPGRYAIHYARQGYAVHLVDPIALHVEQALALAAGEGVTLASAVVGDARQIPADDASADVVLLLGPLYHLVDAEDRLVALQEAHRVLRLGGVVAAAAISQFASLLDGMWRGFIDDPAFEAIVQRDLAEGQHRNEQAKPGYFTTAFFHHPDRLAGELRAAGFNNIRTLAVEGPFWLLPLESEMADDARRTRLLNYLRQIEAEPSLLGASGHLLGLGTAHRRGSGRAV